MKFTIEGSTIILANGDVVPFAYPVAEAIDCEDGQILVVRLKIPPTGEFNENIYGVDYKGSVRWQIPAVRHVTADSPYVSMHRHGGQIEADNWDGLTLTLDLATGAILKRTYNK